MSNTKKLVRDVSFIGMFGAVIIVLQLLSYVVKIGAFNLSLVLIPLVLAAYLFGPKTGAILGGIFGLTVTVCCFTGMDSGGYILISASPVLTTAVCMVKGVAAGFAAGMTAKLLKNKNSYLAIILSAVVAPIVNTGLFILSMLLFFKDILASWAGGTNLVTYIVVGLVGVNFLIEFTANLIAAPSLLRVTKAIKK
ncbi:MAG: ECF transporter S component [Clostridia bacterium]|nr:ECF transporter S component [Clostridia bacterium]